jgi:hypothetical protein
MEGQPGLPAEVSEFLAEILRRNRMRNRMLMDQLVEASGALNSAGILPVLKKGAAMLLTDPASIAARMVSDLDLIVARSKIERAVEALRGIGYRDADEGAQPATLSRSRDAGAIDLHFAPRGPARFSGDAIFDRHSRPVQLPGGTATVILPSATLQILYLTLHDQFHDGDYWRGYVDLRHMVDIARLSALPEGVDWDALKAILSTRYARRAFAAQIINASRLIGMALPPDFGTDRHADLQYRRWLFQVDRPRLAALLSLGTIMLERPPRKHEPANDQAFGAKVGRLGLHLRGLLRARAHGKV